MLKIKLTRHQIEQIAVYMALAKNIEYVTIDQNNESGIGANHYATFHNCAWQEDATIDITDVSTW